MQNYNKLTSPGRKSTCPSFSMYDDDKKAHLIHPAKILVTMDN